MKALSTHRSDGVGSTIQVYLFCYALSKLNNLKFYFDGFGKILNFDKDGKSDQLHTEDWNNFFNLYKVADKLDKNDVIQNIDSNFLMKNLNNIDLFKPFLQNLKNNINYEPKNKYFFENKTNIAVHIRQFVKNQDNDTNPIRNYFDITQKEKYLNLINELLTFKNSNIHIFTTGEVKILDFLEKENVFIHYNESSFSDMYHMIMADKLVMANSSFSYVAHLMNCGESYVNRNFYHPTYSGSKII